MDLHMKNKRDLEDQINDANKNLNELKKRNQMTTFNTSAANDKDKKGDDEEFNIDELVDDLKRDIVRVYQRTIDSHADLHAKNPVDILTVSLSLTLNPSRKSNFNSKTT